MVVWIPGINSTEYVLKLIFINESITIFIQYVKQLCNFLNIVINFEETSTVDEIFLWNFIFTANIEKSEGIIWIMKIDSKFLLQFFEQILKCRARILR